MTKRKFTPPTTFPTEYITRDGRKVVILGIMPNETFPFVGYAVGDLAWGASWTAVGADYEDERTSNLDLFDLPKKQVHWANDYGDNVFGGYWYRTRTDADALAADYRIAVIRREWVEGQLPQYFTEEV
jgi:hypothetical protein